MNKKRQIDLSKPKCNLAATTLVVGPLLYDLHALIG